MSPGDSDVDFVRLVPEGGAPPDEQTVASAFDAGDAPSGDDAGTGGIGADDGDDPFEHMGLDFVELYSDNFQHFGRLAAILDPENPDELIDKAFLAVARRSDPPTSRGVALLEVRDALVRQHRNRFPRPRRELVVLPDGDDPVLDRLDELPPFQRDSLVLHHYAAMTAAEIAAVTNTDADTVDDNLDFAEGTFDASSDASAGDVGDRIRRSLNAALAGFVAEPDVDDFERKLKRKSRKPALLALAGVAAAAVLIVAVALWRADPTGEATIGPDRDSQTTSTTSKKATTSTTVPSVITLPPKPGGSTGTTSGGTAKKGTATTRRGTSGGGGGGGGNNGGGGGGNNGGGGGGGTNPTTGPTNSPTTLPPATTQPPPPPTTQPPPPPFQVTGKSNVSCGATSVYTLSGKGQPGAAVTFGGDGVGGATVGADGNWSGDVTINSPLDVFTHVYTASVTQSTGGSASVNFTISLLGTICG
jgi:hypothetical protein